MTSNVEQRIARDNRNQRIIEGLAILVVLGVIIGFQFANRGTVKDAARQAAKQDTAVTGQLRELNQEVNDANARIGQLEQALVALGAPVPPPLPQQTTSTTRVPAIRPSVTTGATVRPGAGTSTSTTQAPAPTTTTTTTQPTHPPNTLPGGIPCPPLKPLC